MVLSSQSSQTPAWSCGLSVVVAVVVSVVVAVVVSVVVAVVVVVYLKRLRIVLRCAKAGCGRRTSCCCRC